MDPVSALGVAACVAQFVDLAVDLALALSQYFHETVKQAPKLSRELQQEALLLSLVLKELKSTLVTTNDGRPMTGLSSALNNSIVEFSRTLAEMNSRTTLKEGDLINRLKWPFSERENEKYLSKLERDKTTFTLALTTIQRYALNLIMKFLNFCILI